MVAIEFCLENPKGGIRFIPSTPLSLNKLEDADMYLCTVDHNSHCWFPCVSSYNEPCTWKIEVIVEDDLTVISSGNLIEVESIVVPNFTESNNPETQNPNISLKKYHYFLQIPTCAPNIGLVIGRFNSSTNESISEIKNYYEPKLKDLVKHTTSFINEIFEFYEETLTTQFPYGSYKQVFVPDILEDYLSFASITILK